MALYDREVRGDVEGGEELDGGVRWVDAGHADIPSFHGSATLAAQSSAQDLPK